MYFILSCNHLHGICNGFGYSSTNLLPCLSLHPQEAETGFVPSVQDFDKKLAEADAYLQILIDQLKVGLKRLTGIIIQCGVFPSKI